MSHQRLTLPRYSVGVGDRFSHQARPQLAACILAAKEGIEVTPVWNKSNREHTIIGSEPASTRAAAEIAVQEAGWTKPYFCDADHINLSTVPRFLSACDFYTHDVADYINKPADPASIDAFVARHSNLIGSIQPEGVTEALEVTAETLRATAQKYLYAAQQAGEIYRAILAARGEGNFIVEVSMDETDTPQTPVELLIILAALADEGIPVQTIAPKFSGRFNKGVDYAGDPAQFEREFTLDIAVIHWAVKHFPLPENLKLSVHTGSDKFSIYPLIHKALQRFHAGVHLKTAGTTWLEEMIGLAEAGGDALTMAKEIYAEAYAHCDELCKPYATVIDIDHSKLPMPEEVNGWSSEQFTNALRHIPDHPGFNPNLRQLLHVGFKIAAKMGDRYIQLLEANEEVIAKNVTENIFERHIRPVFLGR